jgi:hypothetical protein
MREIIIFAMAIALAGCAGSAPATIGGECQIFKDPGFAVQGKRLKDRQWIGKTQETGIEVCGWQRPRQ